MLLDSNGVKSHAFYQTAMPHGKQAASELLAYHREHGGVSRFLKFEHLFANILKRTDFQEDLEQALECFAAMCRDGLKASDEAPGLREVLSTIGDNGGKAFVVSGGMQTELRDVFAERGLDQYFEAIFGSPDKKEDILAREFATGAMSLPAVFVGDSRYDYDAACHSKMDFIFASAWTEFDSWKTFFSDKSIPIISSLGELLHR